MSGVGSRTTPPRRPPPVNGIPQPYRPQRARLTGSPTYEPWFIRYTPRPAGHLPPGGQSRHERDRPSQQRPQRRLAAPQPPGQHQGRPDVRGGGMRRQRTPMSHPHAVHGHRDVAWLRRVEDEVQPPLGGQSAHTDGGQRSLPTAQPAAGPEHRHEREALHPHRRRRPRGQCVPSGSKQHAQHGEHRRPHAPHRQGHSHDTRCCHAARGSLPHPAHAHHRPRTTWSTCSLFTSRTQAPFSSRPPWQNRSAGSTSRSMSAHPTPPPPPTWRDRASATSTAGLPRAVPCGHRSGHRSAATHVLGGGGA
jgi:hypothetical protein